MPTSDARIRANQANAQRSTGPRTPEGKGRSRANAHKHGLAGDGLVMAEDAAAEVARRHQALLAEMAPQSEAGAILVLQMAALSVRMEAATRAESAAIARKVRHAADDFDEQRLEQAEALLASIAENPRKNLRLLRKSDEGIGLLIEAWADLKADLTRPVKPTWGASHLAKMAHLMGMKEGAAQSRRVGLLTEAALGDFAGLAAHEGGGLDDQGRRAWARQQLLGLMESAVAELVEHAETIDLELVALDRAEAGDRALFDPSKEAALARRYESEARRGFFAAMKEFRRVEQEAAELAASAPPPSASRPSPALGSSREVTFGPAMGPIDRAHQVPWPSSTESSGRPEIVRTPDGSPLMVGKPGQASR